MDIRFATRDDVPVIAELILALATFEKLAHAVTGDQAALAQHLFGPRPFAEVLLAEDEGKVLGFALFFYNFSTFLTKPGVYLEDLFVRQEARGRGIGKALLSRLAVVALDHGCGRLEWAVLDWNAAAIDFYHSLGAEALTEWTVNRVSGSALSALAGRAAE